MADAADYSAMETLRNSQKIEIRSLRPSDRTAFLSAVEKVGSASLYRRFFSARRGFTEKEKNFYLNVDFEKHVALIAVGGEDGCTIVGGGRYIVVEPERAEAAFVVVDRYQGLGIGSMLMRHLAIIAGAANLRELIADVLPENKAMLMVFAKSGFPMATSRESGVIRVTIQLA